MREIDFKQYTSGQKIKRFWNSGKFFDSKGQGWQGSSTLGAYQVAYTYLRVPTITYDDATVIGSVHVTYYVMFKGG